MAREDRHQNLQEGTAQSAEEEGGGATDVIEARPPQQLHKDESWARRRRKLRETRGSADEASTRYQCNRQEASRRCAETVFCLTFFEVSYVFRLHLAGAMKRKMEALEVGGLLFWQQSLMGTEHDRPPSSSCREISSRTVQESKMY